MNATKIITAALAGLVTFAVVGLIRAGPIALLMAGVAGILVGLGVVLALRGSRFGETRTLPVVPGDFFMHRMGSEEGPVPFTTLVANSRAGSLSGDTLVRTPESDWFPAREMSPGVFSKRTWMATLLLSVFAGPLGVDRFYLGKVPSGLLKLLTLGGLGVWSLIDIILIATNRMTDRDGLPLAR